MVDPNAVVADHVPGHGHGHGHRHDHDGGAHDHGSGSDEAGTAVDAGGADGRAVRASKDTPGRHDEAYYGTSAEQLRRPAVGTGQGGRSFAAALGRGGRAGRTPKNPGRR
jgi:hypothetical protein